jgi:hypothetical protein
MMTNHTIAKVCQLGYGSLENVAVQYPCALGCIIDWVTIFPDFLAKYYLVDRVMHTLQQLGHDEY